MIEGKILRLWSSYEKLKSEIKCILSFVYYYTLFKKKTSEIPTTLLWLIKQ